jgi:hemolysin activation/secretion protein
MLVLSGAALAQDYKQVAPKTPKAATPELILPAPSPAAPATIKGNPQLLPELIGLKLVDDPGKVARNGVRLYGITVDSNNAVLDRAGLRNKLARFLDRPLTANDLQTISRVIVEWCRVHDFPLAQVAFPEQDITTGTVQVVVTIFRVGQVKVSGSDWFADHIFTDEMQLEPGDPFDIATLKDDLNTLNRNPFHEVNAVLERSATPGATDLDLHVQDRFPLRVYAGYDNQGLPVSGRDRYSAGLNWGNAFGLDEQFAYQFVTTPDLWRKRERGPGHSNAPRFEAHAANYVAPLPWGGDSVTLFGTYVEQVPNLGANFDQVGHSLQMSFRYDKSVPTFGPLSQQFHLGFDYKRSNNNLAFGGTEVFASATVIQQFLFIYDASLTDRYGVTSLENQFVYSPGGLAHGNQTAVFEASGVIGASANYTYDLLQITRITTLPWQTSAVLRLTGQLASTELLPSEQLGAGGPGSVRGYDVHAVNGSQGGLASFELRSPPLALSRTLGFDVGEQWQALGFYDAGDVSDFHQQQGQPKHAFLESVGVGARLSLGRYLEAQFDYGWQLSKVPGASKLGNLANVSVTLSY